MKFDKNGIAIPIKEHPRWMDILGSFYEQRMQTRMDFKWRLKDEV